MTNGKERGMISYRVCLLITVLTCIYSEPPTFQIVHMLPNIYWYVRSWKTCVEGVLAMVLGERTSSAEDYVLTSFLQCLLHDLTHTACHDVLQNYEAKASHLPEASS